MKKIENYIISLAEQQVLLDIANNETLELAYDGEESYWGDLEYIKEIISNNFINQYLKMEKSDFDYYVELYVETEQKQLEKVKKIVGEKPNDRLLYSQIEWEQKLEKVIKKGI